MRILGFGTYDVAQHPRVGVLFDGLRSHADEVAEINEPLQMSTADRVLILHRPWLAYRLAIRLLTRWSALVRRARRLDRSIPLDAVIVGYMGQFDVVLARLLFRRTTVVLDLLVFGSDTATDRRARSQVVVRLLDLLDRAAVSRADLVLVDTEEQLQFVAPGQRHKALPIPVGAANLWFCARPAVDAEGGRSPLRVVFFGLFTPLQGTPVIGEAIALLSDQPGIQFTLVGRGQDFAATRAAAAGNQGVQWLDWVDPGDLPALVAGHHVCLGIFGTTAKAQRVVPTKVYQGAAAGCAIVTSDTPPQRRAIGDNAVLVPAGDARRLADALRQLAEDRARLSTQRARATAWSRSYAPAAIVAPLRDRLLESRPR